MAVETMGSVVDAAGGALIVFTMEGGLLSYNERFATTFELPPEAFAAGTLNAIVSSLEESGIGPIATLLSTRDALDRGEILLPDGRSFLWRWVPIHDGGARAWFFQDVTTRHQLELALRDAGNWLRMIEMHMTDAIIAELDDDARFVGFWANSGSFFEKPDTMLEGEGLVQAIGEEQGRELDARVRRVLATGVPENFEYVLVRDGERRVFAANVAAMASSEGEAPHATMMIRDVTNAVRMQMQLLETEKLASVGLLAAGVAHEINNPLAYTLLNLEKIQAALRAVTEPDPDSTRVDDIGNTSDAPAEPLLDAVRMCLEGCRRVQAIVQDLRRFSRSDHVESRTEIDVRRVLDFTVAMATPEARRRARIVREFGDVPLVIADEGRLGQVFLNLIVNAMQAIPEGSPQLHEIRLVTSTDPRGRAVVEVRDTGEGMTPAVMARIFEPFYTTKPPGVGTGLGLPICHGIVTSMGGELSVESLRGRGTTFRVVLRAAEPS